MIYAVQYSSSSKRRESGGSETDKQVTKDPVI
jgi:hypothetical protein